MIKTPADESANETLVRERSTGQENCGVEHRRVQHLLYDACEQGVIDNSSSGTLPSSHGGKLPPVGTGMGPGTVAPSDTWVTGPHGSPRGIWKRLHEHPRGDVRGTALAGPIRKNDGCRRRVRDSDSSTAP